MNRRRLLSSILGLGSLGIAGCIDIPGETTPGTDDGTNNGDPVTIASHDLIRRNEGTEEETVTVEGTVEIRQEGLQLVELTAEFFDAEGETLGPHTEALNDFEPEIRSFAIRYPNQGEAAAAVADYEVEVSTVI